MISDNMKNCRQYSSAHEKFGEAFDFIERAIREGLPVGRYDLDGEKLYAFIQEYTSNLKENGKFEGHRRYIDIQFILSGTEVMQVTDIESLTTKTAYDSEKDVEFFEDGEKCSELTLQAGEYGIFFPWDAHKPGLCFGGTPDTVRKIVVKVKA